MTENQPYLQNGKTANFKLGIRMEQEDPHWHAWWPSNWKLWVVFHVATCRGRGILWRPHYYRIHSLFKEAKKVKLPNDVCATCESNWSKEADSGGTRGAHAVFTEIGEFWCRKASREPRDLCIYWRWQNVYTQNYRRSSRLVGAVYIDVARRPWPNYPPDDRQLDDQVHHIPPTLSQWLQLTIDFDSTVVRLLIKGH